MGHIGKRTCGWLAVAFVAALLAGCAAAPSGTVKLKAGDSGTTKALAVGQKVEIVLDANPTTGYQWAVDGDLPAPLEQVGSVQYKAESGALGAGGVDTWTFAGTSAGRATLKLKYWRSFEPTTPPAKTFEITLDVK